MTDCVHILLLTYYLLYNKDYSVLVFPHWEKIIGFDIRRSKFKEISEHKQIIGQIKVNGNKNNRLFLYFLRNQCLKTRRVKI